MLDRFPLFLTLVTCPPSIHSAISRPHHPTMPIKETRAASTLRGNFYMEEFYRKILLYVREELNFFLYILDVFFLSINLSLNQFSFFFFFFFFYTRKFFF